jgi:hypothetical protein
VRYIAAKLSRSCVNHDVASISPQRWRVGLTTSEVSLMVCAVRVDLFEACSCSTVARFRAGLFMTNCPG